MGKGPTDKKSVLMDAAPPAAPDADGEFVSPCAEQRSIGIDLDEAARVGVGDVVMISPDRPPAVRIGKRRIGAVAAADASDIEGCVSLGFRFAGTIADVDAGLRTAIAIVRGRKE